MRALFDLYMDLSNELYEASHHLNRATRIAFRLRPGLGRFIDSILNDALDLAASARQHALLDRLAEVAKASRAGK